MTPHDLLFALGLVLLIEGALYSLFPAGMQQLMAQLARLATDQVRLLGLTSAILGFLMIMVLGR